jgi:hypothetical protein
MSIQHLNETKAIARTAAQLGAMLPEKIAHALAHLEDLSRNAPAAPRPATMARDLAQHIGDPVAMEKALKRAATDLAAADATAKIHGHLAETCGARIRGMMRAHTEQISAAFGNALAADLDTLTTHAGRLPAWFNPSQADTLDPETFAAWSLARDAYARIQSTQTALAPLYAGAIDQDAAIHFPSTAAASLRFAKPSDFTSARDAYAFRDALAGRTERVQGIAGQGSTFVDGLFIPTALAHVGAVFEWATPTEVAERAGLVVAGMVDELVSAR